MHEISEHSRVIQRLRVSTQRLVDLVRSVPDTSIKVPHLEWTVGDTAAHLVAIGETYPRLAQGEPSPVNDLARIAEWNAHAIFTVTERDPRALGDLLEKNLEHFATTMDDFPVDQPFQWHAGIPLRPTAALAVVLGECLVHGWDIARAVGRKWPVEREDAIIVFSNARGILPYYVDTEAASGFRAVFELRLRGGRAVHLHFDGGKLTIDDASPDARPDCRMSVDPSAFLLVSYGRISPLLPSLTGKMLVWDRKPWLALKFDSLLQKP